MRVSRNQEKGVTDLGSSINKKIIKDRVGPYTKIENFTFANKKVQMKIESGEKY
jgi:hypothetical protein